MKRFTVLSIIGILSISVVISGCHRAMRSPSYIEFVNWSSQAFYKHYASACDKLITTVANTSTNEQRINGNDPRLPKILMDMNASYIDVTSNRIWLVIEHTEAPYGVVCERDSLDHHLWRLRVCGDAAPVFVYSVRR